MAILVRYRRAAPRLTRFLNEMRFYKTLILCENSVGRRDFFIGDPRLRGDDTLY